MAGIAATILANERPDRPIIWCSPTGEYRVCERAAVFRAAQIVAWNLREQGVCPGQVVALMLPQGLELIQTWLGLLILGAIPTILPPPNARQPTSLWLANLRHIVQSAQVQALVHDPDFVEQLAPVRDLSRADCRFLDLSELLGGSELLDPVSTSPQQVVLLQHSSGTTGLQKGVALTHSALATQTALYCDRIQLDPARDKIVSWLPLYHDMGLIACLVMPLLTNTELIFMDNFAWALQPRMFLEAVTRHCPTLCWLPNFAFNFFASRIAESQKKDLRLDSVRMWINCSEPVKEESFARFVAAFRDQGVTSDRMASCYAMAENTFAATQSLPGMPLRTALLSAQKDGLLAAGQDPSGATPVVSSGRLLAEHQIRIVDSDYRPVPEGRLGEIYISSPCLLEEYFQRSDLSARTVRDGWYATGDLGCLQEGEVYVCGRQKDLVIIAGKNVFPEDVEDIANQVEGLQPGRMAALGIYDEDDGTEQLVLLAEYGPKHVPTPAEMRRVQRDIKRRVDDLLGVRVQEVHLLPPRSLLKSSSGKISRQRCRQLYLTQIKPGGRDQNP